MFPAAWTASRHVVAGSRPYSSRRLDPTATSNISAIDFPSSPASRTLMFFHPARRSRVPPERVRPDVHFLTSERSALFIDGANLYSASRNLGFDVDYRSLLEFFRRKTYVI